MRDLENSYNKQNLNLANFQMGKSKFQRIFSSSKVYVCCSLGCQPNMASKLVLYFHFNDDRWFPLLPFVMQKQFCIFLFCYRELWDADADVVRDSECSCSSLICSWNVCTSLTLSDSSSFSTLCSVSTPIEYDASWDTF